MWVIFGTARFCLKTTFLCNLIRLNASLWTLPENPLDPSGYVNLDVSTWTQVVKPDLFDDTSVGAIVHGRFKSMHDVQKKVLKDAQLTWECRRWLEGDDPPWDGAVVMHGCLVWDLIDHSGWNTGTSFGGNFFTGLVPAVTEFNVSTDDQTMDDTRVTLPDPNFPAEYYQSGYKGTLPSVPGVIFYAGKHSGIKSSEWTWKPATDISVVAGGHSMPGTNEAISAAILAAGSLASVIPGVPDLGPVADAILKPIYTDVFLAFGKWQDLVRAQRLSTKGFYYHERFQDGADAGYTIAWLLAMRAGLWESREQIHHKISVQDGACGWIVGQNGYGHFFIGDRVGSSVRGMPPGKIFVDQVSDLTFSYSRTEAPHWDITIGSYEPEDPVAEAWEQFEDILSIAHDLGVM